MKGSGWDVEGHKQRGFSKVNKQMNVRDVKVAQKLHHLSTVRSFKRFSKDEREIKRLLEREILLISL